MPEYTPLLQAAQAQGLDIVRGLEMMTPQIDAIADFLDMTTPASIASDKIAKHPRGGDSLTACASRGAFGGMSEPEGVQWPQSNWPFLTLKSSRGEHARHRSMTMSGDG